MKNIQNLRTDGRYAVLGIDELLVAFVAQGTGQTLSGANTFKIYPAGSAINTVAFVSQMDQSCAAVTRLVKNSISQTLLNLLPRNLDLSGVQLIDEPADRAIRNPIFFRDNGFGLRPPDLVYDRSHSPCSRLVPGDIDLTSFFKQGLGILHSTGIFASVDTKRTNGFPVTSQLLIDLFKQAKQFGTLVSYDLGYRAVQWESSGGIPAAMKVAQQILPHVDILLGNEGFFCEHLLGEKVSSLKDIHRAFPNLKIIACTARGEEKRPDIHPFFGVLSDGSIEVRNQQYPEVPICDRVGAGDAFNAGILVGLLENRSPEEALHLGLTMGAYIMSVEGDIPTISPATIAQFGGRLKR